MSELRLFTLAGAPVAVDYTLDAGLLIILMLAIGLTTYMVSIFITPPLRVIGIAVQAHSTMSE